MQLTHTAFFGFSLMTAACTSTTPASHPKEPLRGGVLDFRLDVYDGRTIKGRLLVSATESVFRIDSRQATWYTLDYDGLHTCGKTEPQRYVHFDRVVMPAPPDRIITLQHGTWYGENVEFAIMYHREDRGEGPDCIETTLTARTVDGHTIARLPVRIERTDKPAALGPV
jgi:hypothetical protein